MSDERPVGVLISRHAVIRFTERWPDFPGDPADHMHYEMHDALREGRRASNRPRWTVVWSRKKTRSEGTVRFMWNRELTRCYVALKKKQGSRREEFKQAWFVVTVLGRIDTDEDQLAVRRGDTIRRAS